MEIIGIVLAILIFFFVLLPMSVLFGIEVKESCERNRRINQIEEERREIINRM